MSQSNVISVTGVPTHHFFVMDDVGIPMCNSAGEILVYTSRENAIREANRRGGSCIVAGMGDAKWAMFQREERYVVDDIQ
jgi:hypothetical protein